MTGIVTTSGDTLDKYVVFTSLGVNGKPPTWFKKRRSFFLYDVRYDGIHKERYAVDKYKPNISLKIISSGVVT